LTRNVAQRRRSRFSTGCYGTSHRREMRRNAADRVFEQADKHKAEYLSAPRAAPPAANFLKKSLIKNLS
ncbi:MAG: hypothetical protein ACLFOY_05745, partial [Desulfatibacillaceae bacterium]